MEKSSEEEFDQISGENDRGNVTRENKNEEMFEMFQTFLSSFERRLDTRMRIIEENLQDLALRSAPQKQTKALGPNLQEKITHRTPKNLSIPLSQFIREQSTQKAVDEFDYAEVYNQEEDFESDVHQYMEDEHLSSFYHYNDDREEMSLTKSQRQIFRDSEEGTPPKKDGDVEKVHQKKAVTKTPPAKKQVALSSVVPDDDDDDDKSSSSSTSEDRDSKKNSKTSKRRDSIIRRAVKAAADPKNMVTYTMQAPSYSHIHLSKMTVPSIHKFLVDIVAYQSAYGIRLPVTTLIASNVAEQLMAKDRSLTSAKFHSLTGEQLLSKLQAEIRPGDKLTFIKTLDRNVTFELQSGYKPTAIDFKPMYEAVLVFKKKFLTVFEMLSEDNDEQNIPSTDTKPGGLIHCFNSKIPFNYGQNVYTTLEVKKFATLYDYERAFSSVLEGHYKFYLKSRTLQQTFTGSALASQAFTSAKTNHSSGNNTRMAPRAHRLQHIADEGSDIEARIHGQNFDESLLRVDDEELMELPQPSTKPYIPASIDQDYDNDSLDEAAIHFANDREQAVVKELTDLAAINNNAIQPFLNKKPNAPSSAPNSQRQKSDSSPNGCYKMLLLGECPNGERCSYSHDRSVLQKTHSELEERLRQSKYKTFPAPTRAIIPRDNTRNDLKKTQAAASHDLRTISVVLADNVENDSKLQLLCEVCDPSLHELLRNMILSAVPEVTFYSSMHREGKINLTPEVQITLHKVLFDTGALHGSYIASRFVEEHQAALRPFLRPCKIIVTLADNKTKLLIDTVAFLPVTFFGDDFVKHTAVVAFCVLNTCANDMIIGLPAIVKSFSKLLKQMIDQAVADAASMSEIVPDQLSAVSVSTDIPPVIYPWTQAKDLEAPEDLETDLPSSFPDALHYMEMSHEDAVKEFHDLIQSHVDPQFREATNIVHLLKTKGVKVFVPSNWDGINGVPDFDLQWKSNMPESMKPRARPINPKLYEHAKKEFDRLMNYFYKPSSSPIASCLVIAPKATPPYIRFCGDYVGINKYIHIGHYPIPNIQYSLEKISTYKIFVDIDMANSFHQIRLSPATSEKLSVQTPWGQVAPIFMPEGIGPASGQLQSIVSNIFVDDETKDWLIAIFDNLLILAHDYDDAYKKLEILLDRCIQRNVVLKFAKSWLGFDNAKFFGYVCRHGHYELSEDRKNSLKEIPFPRSLKQMQSFLGAALFFRSFVPNYSTLAAPLNDMVRQNFPWNDESIWTTDYRAVFDEFKTQLQNATAIFYPDYSLPWILRTDASNNGIGGVLLQEYRASPESEPVYQPLGFFSKKFSPQALNWTTIEKEGYGVYGCVLHFSYYLRCKSFILETDHNNLLWIEASAVPKVIRWRIFLQSFDFLLRHIKGKFNTVADWLSRAYEPVQQAVTLAMMISDSWPPFFDELYAIDTLVDSSSAQTQSFTRTDTDTTADEQRIRNVLTQVHGGRMGHFGARETWKTLNRLFPGHGIPYRIVAEFVATCAVCQKDRLGMADQLAPVVRHLKPLHRRAMIGIDTLTVTPRDKFGNQYLTVIKNHTTHFAALYPAPHHDALSTATAVFQFICWFGLIDSIISDPGSEFMNEVVSHLTKWFGIRHVFSLVDRHESNGVEGTNKIILRLLKALVMDERVVDQWSSPTILPLIQFLLNSHESSETGIVPFHAHFGNADSTYFRMPKVEEGDSMRRAHEYVQLLDANLKLLSEISNSFQRRLIEERTSKTPIELQNKYQPGDLVLWQRNPDEPLPNKLTPKFTGPYEVINQDKNDVTCKHIILGDIKVFHVTRLKMFFGDIDEARRVAMIDNDQYVVIKFIAYRGDPLTRTTMEFEVEFADGSVLWLPWSKDLFDTVQYEEFCRSKPELFTLLYDTKTADKLIRDLNNSPINEVKPGDIVFVDLRSYGSAWYKTLPLPDIYHSTYCAEYRYTQWHNKKKTKIVAVCSIFNETFIVDHLFVKRYGTHTKPVDNAIVIDNNMVKRYPMLLPSVST